MSPTLRKTLLFTALAAAGALVGFDRHDDASSSIATAVVPHARAERNGSAIERSTLQSSPTKMILAILPRTPASPHTDAFVTRDWNPPPPKIPPADPVAPPLPFTYVGKKFEGGQWQVFLAREDETLIVKDKERIDDTYRVETIKPPTMTITYLPLQETQSLTIEDKKP